MNAPESTGQTESPGQRTSCSGIKQISDGCTIRRPSCHLNVPYKKMSLQLTVGDANDDEDGLWDGGKNIYIFNFFICLCRLNQQKLL